MARTLVSAVLLLGFLVAVHATNPVPPTRQEEPLLDRVARLERQVAALEEQLTSQEEVREDIEHRVKALETWMAMFPVAAEAFEKTLDLVIEQGFTYAAPNLHSRETLIRGLRSLGRSLAPKERTRQK